MVWYDVWKYTMVSKFWYGLQWYGMQCMVWYGMVWYGMVWYVKVWYGIVCYGIVWYSMVWYLCGDSEQDPGRSGVWAQQPAWGRLHPPPTPTILDMLDQIHEADANCRLHNFIKHVEEYCHVNLLNYCFHAPLRRIQRRKGFHVRIRKCSTLPICLGRRWLFAFSALLSVFVQVPTPTSLASL